MENWRNLAGKSLFPKHQLRGLRFIVVTCVQYIFKVKLHIKIMCKDAFFLSYVFNNCIQILNRIANIEKTEHDFFVFKIPCCFTNEFFSFLNCLCRRHKKAIKSIKPTKPYVMLLHGFVAICSLGMSGTVYFLKTL